MEISQLIEYSKKRQRLIDSLIQLDIDPYPVYNPDIDDEEASQIGRLLKFDMDYISVVSDLKNKKLKVHKETVLPYVVNSYSTINNDSKTFTCHQF